MSTSERRSILPGIGYTAERRVWLVEPDADLRTTYRALAEPDGEVLDPGEFAAKLQRGARPSALLIDVAALPKLDPGAVPVLDGVLRLVVATAASPSDAANSYLSRPRVRVLAKPLELDRLRAALAWLRRTSDADSWAMDLEPAAGSLSNDDAADNPAASP